ncbi:CheR family methyltransferase [Microvirga puerhi]|uniref:protein-glutamate O-methyltransferase n=1 Tax=Microvirga puerhi TaxID=2876078 RepID=A0ABS7VSN1_9HYPH|nr:protein-glutamate O-methyltransferase CheR [Microvirga puerhi]MBZ6078560.1 protein-glutamate O-methyltransferase CheR [Microvirga puerhi]
MNESEFEFLRGFLKARSGLALPPEKRYLVESRLAPVCRNFQIADLAELIRSIRISRSLALESAVVDAMTTNETFFFRDKGPFDLFRDVLLPRYLTARTTTRQLRIWCAAASTGQEPYSLAMLLEDAVERTAGWKIDIVATDISTDVLNKAKAGLYNQFEVQRGLPIQLLLKHFTQVGDQWQISQKIRSRVSFQGLNLIKDFTALGIFDIIYCRNVLIYFDAATKSNVLARIANSLAADGSLILGAAETVLGLSDAFTPDPAHRGLYSKVFQAVETRPLSLQRATSR